ncbi:hypothetical protein BH23ACT1_BH23ACT1_07770 [soil metagenome]
MLEGVLSEKSVGRSHTADRVAEELWRHVSWLARYENFSELKRDRTLALDLV